MTKLRFDLATISPKSAVFIRTSFQPFFDANDPKVRLTNGGMVLELDYGPFELEQFQGMNPSPRKALASTFSSSPAGLVEQNGDAAYKERLKKVMDEARDECRDFDNGAVNIPDISGDLARPGAGGIEDVLANQPGLIIGGMHTEHTHRAPVMDMLENGTLSRANNTGLLFVEEIPVNCQDEIDAYLGSDADAEMPNSLKAYMQALSKAFASDFVKMLELSKANGVRVVGTDADEVKIFDEVEQAVHHERRCAAQNMKSYEIMQAAMLNAPGQKFVGMIGGAHSNTHEGGVPGLSQLLGVPAVTVDVDGKMTQAPDDPSKHGAPIKEVAEFIDGYIAKMKDVFDNSHNDVLNWREQRAAAEVMAGVFMRGGGDGGGPLRPGADVADLLSMPAVERDLQELKARAEKRQSEKEELAQLLRDNKPGEFSTKLAELHGRRPDLLSHDGVEHVQPCLVALAVELGHANLAGECIDRGAALTPAIVDKIFTNAIAFREKAVADNGVAPDVADATFAADLQILLGKGLDPNGKNQLPRIAGDGKEVNTTPLQQMIQKDLGVGIEKLMTAGASTTVRDGKGRSMIELALHEGKPGAIATLVDNGVDVNAPGPDGYSPLIMALQKGDLACAKMLVAKGANPDARGPGGKTALHLASEIGDKTMIDALVGKRADVTLADDAGDTAGKAMLVSELKRQVEQAVNGDRRAAEAAEVELTDKTAELATNGETIVALQAEHDALLAKIGGPDPTNAADVLRLAEISANLLPAATLAKTTLEHERDAIQLRRDGHRAADPMAGLVTASEAEIVVRQQALDAQKGEISQKIARVKGMISNARTDEVKQDAITLLGEVEGERQRLEQAIRDEQAHLAALNKPQPIDDTLILQTAEAILAGGGVLANAGDVDTLVAGAGGRIDTARDQMLDRQTKVQQMAKAVRAADGAEIDRLAGLDASLVHATVPGDRTGRNMLLYAAKQQKLDSVTRLLANGADITSTDKRGAHALHTVFATRQDDPGQKVEQRDIVQALVGAGADVNALDAQDRTCLHLSCLDGNPDAITWLINNGADQALVDKRGWTAKDVVMATTKPIAEKAYADAAQVNLSPPLILPVEQNLSTLDILSRATKCENPADVERIEAMYRDLYSQPAFRNMLDLIALDAAHGHVAKADGETDTGLRIFVAAQGQVGLLYNKNQGEGHENMPHVATPVGAYDENAHVVMVGAGPSEGNFVAGTLIHELTHAATRLIYGTEDIPGDVPDGGYTDANGKMNPAMQESPYVKAIMADARNAAALGDPRYLGVNTDESRIRDVLFGRFDGNYKEKGDKALLQEYLVGIPQLIAEFGRDAVHRVAPKLVEYYEEDFSTACESKADDYDDVSHLLNNEALLAELGDPPVREAKTAMSAKSPRATVDGIMDTVEKICISREGTVTLAEKDAKLADKLSLPFGPGNFKLDDRAQRALDKKLATMRKALEAVYDTGDLPDKIDADMLKSMTQELVNLAENASGRTLKNGIADATGSFVRESRFNDLESRLGEGAYMSNRDVAELTLMRAENRVWADAHPGPGAPPRIDFKSGDHSKTLDGLEQALNAHLEAKAQAVRDGLPEGDAAKKKTRALILAEATDLDDFIDNQVAVLAADRGMRVARGDVGKIDARRAKNAWYAELQNMAV